MTTDKLVGKKTQLQENIRPLTDEENPIYKQGKTEQNKKFKL